MNIVNDSLLFEAVMVKKVFNNLTSKIDHSVDELHLMSAIIDELYLIGYDYCTLAKLLFIQELILFKINKLLVKNHLDSNSLLLLTFIFNNLNIDYETKCYENNDIAD